MNTRGKTAIAWLGHPATVLALLLLIVNDHLLKSLWPGLVTGKLSDAAGLVLAPPLLALIVRRPAAALWSVGVGFTLVKSSGYAAEQASAAWSLVGGPSLIRADLTDLIALPFLAVAWWAHRSATAQPVAPRWVRALRMGVLLPLALLGVAATSPAPEPDMATRVVSTPSTIYLISQSFEESWVTSADSGATWTRDPDAQRPIPPSGPAPSPTTPSPSASAPALPPPPDGAAAERACSAAEPQVCYRVVPGALGVERSTDGGVTWASDWRVSEDDRRKLARHYYELDDVDADLVSTAVAVHDKAGGGHVVVVANRRDGFAVRDAAGRWERVGFPPDDVNIPEIGKERGEDLLFRYGGLAGMVAPMMALVVITGAAIASTRLGRRGSAWWVGPPVLTIAALVLILMDYAALDTDTLIFYPFLVVTPALVVIGSVATAIGATVSILRGGPHRAGWAVRVWTTGALAGAVGAAIWLLPAPFWLKVAADTAAVLTGILVAWHAATRVPPSEPAVAPPIPYPGWRP